MGREPRRENNVGDQHHHWTKYLIATLKIVIPVAIIIFLVSRLDQRTWQALREPQDGRLLVVAFLVGLAAVLLSFVRWFLLVRALDLPFRFSEALRLGFLTYLLNFISVGSVGGDLFKAYFIARQQPGRRAEAVATVVVDRMFGMYALLIVTGVAILVSDIADPSAELRAIYNLTFIGMGVGGVALVVVLLPGFTSGSLSEFLSGLPRVGGTIRSLLSAVRMYRNRLGILTVVGIISVLVHCLLALSIYLISAALFVQIPTLGEHLVFVPLSMVAGALPLTPAGLGTFEAAMAYLYSHVPGTEVLDGAGITVALVFRALTIVIATVGIIFYWTSRSEVKQVMHEVEEGEERSA